MEVNNIRKIHKNASISKDTKIIGHGTLHIEAHVVIEANVLIDLGEGGTVKIGYRSKLKYGCILRAHDGIIIISDRSTVGEYSILAGHGGLVIGNAVIIAGHSYISASSHIFSGIDDHIRFQGELVKGISIDDGVWIGARCVILDGINLGLNCIIGAGSVVTKSMKSNMVCYGSPCREINNIKEEIE